ncbi:MAG TPA: IS4 family transposase, partial [Ktedonobacteraceae bacterium]
MPQRDQHNAIISLSQAPEAAQHCWDDLVRRLPADLESQARKLGAFQRVRAIKSSQALLRAVLGFVLSSCSLKVLSGWSRLIGISTCTISAQAWNKRLRRCGPWLLWLLTSLLDVRLRTPALPTRGRVLMVDATHLSEMGPKGETWRLHCAYDLLQGQLAWVQVTDHTIGESLARLPIQTGDLLVADKGYCKAPQLLAVDAAGAFTLARFSAWHLPLFARSAPAATSEFRLDVRGWLSGLRPGTYQRYAAVDAQGKRLGVRLIVVVFSVEQTEALRERARQKAREKGSKLSEQSLFYAGFHLMVTTLPEKQWPMALVLELYRCRWQIEILFKRIKQVLDTHRLSCSNSQSAQVMILALLVAWLLIEDETAVLQRQITDAEPDRLPLSLWQLNQWAWLGLSNVVRGWWSPAQL